MVVSGLPGCLCVCKTVPVLQWVLMNALGMCVCLCVHVSWSIYHNVVIRQMTFKAGRFVLVTELL